MGAINTPRPEPVQAPAFFVVVSYCVWRHGWRGGGYGSANVFAFANAPVPSSAGRIAQARRGAGYGTLQAEQITACDVPLPLASDLWLPAVGPGQTASTPAAAYANDAGRKSEANIVVFMGRLLIAVNLGPGYIPIFAEEMAGPAGPLRLRPRYHLQRLWLRQGFACALQAQFLLDAGAGGIFHS